MESQVRLVCPNCAAQYEVDASVIPPEGRDVQCSNCGHTWLAQRPRAPQPPPQPRRPVPPAPGGGAVTPRPEAGAAAAARAAAPVAPAAPEAEVARARSAALPPDDGSYDGDDDAGEIGSLTAPDRSGAGREPSPEPVTPELERRRALDAAVFDVLREEAEREAAARRAEAAAFEMRRDPVEPPAAPVPPPEPERRTPERVAAIRGAVAEEADAAGRSGREALPDIEEINSTLDRRGADAPRIEPAPEEVAARRSGFRSGFIVVILGAALATGIYAYAPRIAEAYPPLAPALGEFTGAVDAGRLWLDGAARSATEALRGLTGGEAAQDAGAAGGTAAGTTAGTAGGSAPEAAPAPAATTGAASTGAAAGASTAATDTTAAGAGTAATPATGTAATGTATTGTAATGTAATGSAETGSEATGSEATGAAASGSAATGSAATGAATGTAGGTTAAPAAGSTTTAPAAGPTTVPATGGTAATGGGG